MKLRDRACVENPAEGSPVLSRPSAIRTIAAVACYAVAGLCTLAWKLMRDGLTESAGIAPWIVGVLPNFVPAAFLPFLIFATRRPVRPREYFTLAAAILVSLCMYEFAQLAMPKRTFDWSDIAASIVGCCVGCIIGWILFFQLLGRGDRPADAPA